MVNELFQWKQHPKAEAILVEILDECCFGNSFIGNLSDSLLHQTSTRLFDWLDHLIVGYSDELVKALEECGFISDTASQSYRVFHHPGAQLPSIVVNDNDQPFLGLAVKVDSIADFLMVRGISGYLEGAPLGAYRRCCVSSDNGYSLWVVERRGTLTMEPTHEEGGYVEKYLLASEMWRSRPRDIDEAEAIKYMFSLAEDIVNILGKDMAAWIICECERDFWQSRNRAAQIQKNRQDRLGMGWSNHDHHTFRSSREHFHQLVRLFEMLGFHCRERFYAGETAGWGAQVMENSNCGITLFLDVDLSPTEIEIDFAHHPLEELDELGTIGLWCALHGDSILKAGMHHLEALFFFEELTQDLSREGVKMMQPFSDFSYLRQAFTEGEIWAVDPKRVTNLIKKGLILPADAESFTTCGALGSHLENLQRRDGFKGFNEKNVSFIIKKTDPRKFGAV